MDHGVPGSSLGTGFLPGVGMRGLAWLERILWMTGLLCAGYCAFLGAEAEESRRVAARFDGRQPGHAAVVTDVMGRIEIPALRLSAPITRDDDVTSLRRGVGHIPGTALPGGLGTVGLAGHRDSFFRPLRGITPRMEIRLIDRTGTYHYVVDSTEVVTPDKVRVLDIRQRPELTLITCFPFEYVGTAPKRFVVHAHLLSAAPDGVVAVRQEK
jgi:sortase A